MRKSVKPVFSLAGNGDLGADRSLDAYRDATGLALYYTIYRKGIRFIFLSVISTSGNGKHICHLGPEQLTWLTNQLNADTDSTTAIFFHAPVFETTWHSEDREREKSPGRFSDKKRSSLFLLSLSSAFNVNFFILSQHSFFLLYIWLALLQIGLYLCIAIQWAREKPDRYHPWKNRKVFGPGNRW